MHTTLKSRQRAWGQDYHKGINHNSVMTLCTGGEAKITKSPDVAAIAVGDKVTLTCNVENVAVVIINDLRYQWFKEGSGIIDKTGKSIELSLLKLSDIGKYSCKVTCNKLGDWSVKSDPVPVDVNRELSACSPLILNLMCWTWYIQKRLKLCMITIKIGINNWLEPKCTPDLI